MEGAVAVDDLVAFGGQGAFERQRRVEAFAVLFEVDDAEFFGFFDGAGVGLQLAGDECGGAWFCRSRSGRGCRGGCRG